MTHVEFHTGVTDPVHFACRLLRKAVRQGARVQVTVAPDMLAELDVRLWTFEDREFVPHVCLPGAPVALARRTPLWLSTEVQQGEAPRLLVNMGCAAPPSLQQLDRLIEIVSAEPDDAAAGRQRWRQYKSQGLDIVHHPDAGAASS